MVLYLSNKVKLSCSIIVGPLQKHFLVLARSSTGSSHSTDANNGQHQQDNYSKGLSEEEEFRVLQLIKKKRPKPPRRNANEVFFKTPREKDQSFTQDWGSIWPGIRSFHPATVPLPVRMGYPHTTKATPDKWGNAELMKIANFLHLTPPVIKKQCEAIKGFCTPWPEELETEEAQNYYYPVTVTTSSYLHSSPTLRDPRARIVSLRVSIDALDLDYHAEDKLLRLVGGRFDPKTRILTLMADRCPLSSQNMEYCFYLLTVLYNEALKKEPWEHEKDKDDFESYIYSISKSKLALDDLEQKSNTALSKADVENYIETVSKLHNEGEDEEILLQLRNATLKVLNLVQ